MHNVWNKPCNPDRQIRGEKKEYDSVFSTSVKFLISVRGRPEPSPAVTEQTGAESCIPCSLEPFVVPNQANVGVSGPWQETQRFPKQVGEELALQNKPLSKPGNSLQ